MGLVPIGCIPKFGGPDPSLSNAFPDQSVEPGQTAHQQAHAEYMIHVSNSARLRCHVVLYRTGVDPENFQGRGYQ